VAKTGPGPAAPVPGLARVQRLVVLATATTTRLARRLAGRAAGRAAAANPDQPVPSPGVPRRPSASPVPCGSSSRTPVPAEVPEPTEVRADKPRELRVDGVVARGRCRRPLTRTSRCSCSACRGGRRPRSCPRTSYRTPDPAEVPQPAEVRAEQPREFALLDVECIPAALVALAPRLVPGGRTRRIRALGRAPAYAAAPPPASTTASRLRAARRRSVPCGELFAVPRADLRDVDSAGGAGCLPHASTR
jgi:hypothetical protein